MLGRASEVNRAILRRGGQLVRQRGSHRRFEVIGLGPDGRQVTVSTTVPQHSGDIPIGTVRAIEKDLAPVFGERWLTA